MSDAKYVKFLKHRMIEAINNKEFDNNDLQEILTCIKTHLSVPNKENKSLKYIIITDKGVKKM